MCSYIPVVRVVASKTIPDSRPKWTKSIPVFRPKRLKNPTLWGGTYLYGLYKGVPLPPGGQGLERGVLIPHSRFLFRENPAPRTSVVAVPKNVFFPNLRSVPKFWRIPLPPVADKSSIPLTFLESRDESRPIPHPGNSHPDPVLAFTWIVSDRIVKGIGTLGF